MFLNSGVKFEFPLTQLTMGLLIWFCLLHFISNK